MKKILMVLLTMSLLFAGCEKKEDNSSQSHSDKASTTQQESSRKKSDDKKNSDKKDADKKNSGKKDSGKKNAKEDDSDAKDTSRKPSSKTNSAEHNNIPGSYTVPNGWEKSEKYSTDSRTFYIEEGHENDKTPDNISIHVGKNKYSLDQHEQFRDAIVKQLSAQLSGVDAQINGDGTYTKQGDILYIFTISEVDVITTQYYIVKDHGFCLIHLTNYSKSGSSDQAARDMADSFVWNPE